MHWCLHKMTDKVQVNFRNICSSQKMCILSWFDIQMSRMGGFNEILVIVNSSHPSAASMRQWTGSSLAHTMAWRRTWTNAGLLSIGLLGTDITEVWIVILSFSFKKMHLKMSAAKVAPFYPGGYDLTHLLLLPHICINELGQHWFR